MMDNDDKGLQAQKALYTIVCIICIGITCTNRIFSQSVWWKWLSLLRSTLANKLATAHPVPVVVPRHPPPPPPLLALSFRSSSRP